MNKLNPNKILKAIDAQKLLIFIDQSLFALFNFGSIFVLSKLASISVFSSFVLFQSNIFFLYIFCTFFLSSPILVLFPKRWKDRAAYLKVLFWTNILITLVFSTVLFYLLNRQGVNVDYRYVFLIPMLMSLFELFKKYMFSSFKINLRHAVISSILLNTSFFLSVVYFRGELSLSLILNLYAFAYLLANIYLFIVFLLMKIMGITFLFPVFKKEDQFSQILTHHFVYSKWIILGGVAFWGYTQGLFIYSKILGVSDLGIGKIRTIQNLLGVVNIFIISVENFYTPFFSKFIAEKNNSEVHQLVTSIYKKHSLKVVGLLLLVFVFAMVFYQLLYFEKYGQAFLIISLFTLSQLVLFMLRPIIISLKSIEVTQPFFLAHLAAVLVMASFGYVIIRNYEYYGMAITFVVSNIVFTIVVTYFYWKKVLTHS